MLNVQLSVVCLLYKLRPSFLGDKLLRSWERPSFVGSESVLEIPYLGEF